MLNEGFEEKCLHYQKWQLQSEDETVFKWIWTKKQTQGGSHAGKNVSTFHVQNDHENCMVLGFTLINLFITYWIEVHCCGLFTTLCRICLSGGIPSKLVYGNMRNIHTIHKSGLLYSTPFWDRAPFQFPSKSIFSSKPLSLGKEKSLIKKNIPENRKKDNFMPPASISSGNLAQDLCNFSWSGIRNRGNSLWREVQIGFWWWWDWSSWSESRKLCHILNACSKRPFYKCKKSMQLSYYTRICSNSLRSI